MLIKTPYRNFDTDGRITGNLYYESSSGLYLWGYNGKYYLSTTIGLQLLVDDKVYSTSYFTLNGKNYWSGDGLYLFYDSSEGYVISSSLGYGLEAGDTWWKSSGGIEGNYVEQLDPEDESEPTIKVVSIKPIVGYVGDTLLGKYQELDEFGVVNPAGAILYVGLKKFIDDQSTPVYYTQSESEVDGHYSYGAVRHDGTGWIIGTRNSGAWWTGTEPDVDNPVTFTKQGTAETDITVTFNSYVANTSKTSVYFTEVSTYI